MLAINSLKYMIPYKSQDSEHYWSVDRRNVAETLQTNTFNYTLLIPTRAKRDDGVVCSARVKFTFVYDGPSVRPSGKTLRIFGSDITSEFVSWLSTRKQPSDWRQFMDSMMGTMVSLTSGLTRSVRQLSGARR
jgi:hypothetical protein